MHGANEFLRTLAIVLVAAGITTIVFQKLRLPVVFGYLLAGFVISPNMPAIPLQADSGIVQTLSELGVILLMFTLGLEFSLRRWLKLAPTAGLIALGETALLILLGYLVGQAFGWSTLESVFTGAIVAISSTTIIVKAFAEQSTRGSFKDIVLGVLIAEDLIAILLLAVLTTAAQGSGLGAAQLSVTVARLISFLVAFLTVGILLIPRSIRLIMVLHRPETTVVATIGLAFACALLAQYFGYSVALGAFLAGALAAESGSGPRLEKLILPVRDLFVAIFFVAVGMLIDPKLILQYWPAVAVLTCVVVIGKVIGVSVGSFLTGHSVRSSVQAGMTLTQIGEFSFIIATVGLTSGAIRPFLYPVAVAVSAITALTTPFMIKRADRAGGYIDSKLPRPIQTFVALYGSWIARGRTSNSSPGIGRSTILLALEVLLLAALLVGSSLEATRITDVVANTLNLQRDPAGAVILAGTAALAAPLVYALIRTARTIARAIALRALPAAPDNAPDYARAARSTFMITVQIGLLLPCGAALAALTQPFLPSARVLWAMIAVTAVLAVVFWRNARDLEGHARAGAEVVAAVLTRGLDAEPEDRAPTHPLNDLLRSLGEPEAENIADDSAAIGRTLASLNLRGRTGATILAVRRAGQDILLPAGGEVIRAGDVVILAGSQEAIEEARRELSAPPTGA
jgi:monovalent cation:H+ antiporter-2, CPA2 family